MLVSMCNNRIFCEAELDYLILGKARSGKALCIDFEQQTMNVRRLNERILSCSLGCLTKFSIQMCNLGQP